MTWTINGYVVTIVQDPDGTIHAYFIYPGFGEPISIDFNPNTPIAVVLAVLTGILGGLPPGP